MADEPVSLRDVCCPACERVMRLMASGSLPRHQFRLGAPELCPASGFTPAGVRKEFPGWCGRLTPPPWKAHA